MMPMDETSGEMRRKSRMLLDMKHGEIVIPGNPGIVLARVAPLLSAWLGDGGCVLGGGTVLAARWQHRVSTDIDILDLGVFTDRDLYDLLVAQKHNAEVLDRVLASITNSERATIASELRSLPRHWSSGEPVRDPLIPSSL